MIFKNLFLLVSVADTIFVEINMTDVAATTPQAQQPANNMNVNNTNVNTEATPPFFLLSKTELLGLLKVTHFLSFR